MRVLIVFSDPPGQAALRLDKEDRLIAQMARQYSDSVSVERQHASQIDDIHALITKGTYDVIQFSGHGSPDGIFLEKSDLAAFGRVSYARDFVAPGAVQGQAPENLGSGELVSPQRLLSLLDLASKSPLVVILLCCYSGSSIPLLANAAPFVITSRSAVDDAACILFISGFYDSLFSHHPVQRSYEHALSLLKARGFDSDCFRLSRRSLIKRANGLFVESNPDPYRDSILVNLDAVASRLGSFGMSEEELCHLLARKLRVHSWIFDGANDRAVIPVGRLLFGEFTWQNAKDVVLCTRLMKLRADIPRSHWELWLTVLTSYNDLAASEYRSLPKPADPSSRPKLEDAVRVFQHHVAKYFRPLLSTIEKLGFDSVVPHVEMAIAAIDKAEDQLAMSRYPQLVQSLETALTNFHEVATGLQPPEETTSSPSPSS